MERDEERKRESSDAEIGMNNGRRAVWIVRLSPGNMRAHWNTAKGDEEETTAEYKRWIMRRYRKWDCK